MVLVIYDSGIDEDLAGVLTESGVAAYTKQIGATGTGRKGHRWGTQIWPGTNNLLWIVLPDERVSGLVGQLTRLKESYMRAPALQIFVFPVETIE